MELIKNEINGVKAEANGAKTEIIGTKNTINLINSKTGKLNLKSPAVGSAVAVFGVGLLLGSQQLQAFTHVDYQKYATLGVIFVIAAMWIFGFKPPKFNG